MNFSTVQKVLSTIRAGDNAEANRSDNRAKVLRAANNNPLMDPDEAKKAGLKIFCRFGEMMTLLAHARRQYLSAFWSNQHFFKVTIPAAPPDHQSEWETFITDEINRPLRKSKKYFELHRSRWASVVLHGIAPMMWYKRDGWCPDYVAIADTRIPTDTTSDLENLGWFAVLHKYTPGELMDAAFDGKKKNGWDKEAVAQILKSYKFVNNMDPAQTYDWDTNFEKTVELLRQDGAYWASDAMPSIPLWHFYFLDTSEPDNAGWFMRIVPKDGSVRGVAGDDDFLWTSEKMVAPDLSQIAHFQLGDLNNDSPFKINAVRSLGFALLEPCFYNELTRCRMLQHVHDNFNIWLRSTDPVDRARAGIQEFSNLGVLRPGISVVPQQERHQIDAQLVEMAMAQLKQLQQEASSSYTQSTDSGTQREQTAFETRVKMEQVNAMLSGLLLQAFVYESYAYEEICRRFCLTDTKDKDILRFQKQCKAAGIPRQFLDVDLWDVEPVTPLGMGNPTVAAAASQQLMGIRPMFDPTAQQEILHEATLQITQDPRKASRWVPLGKKPILSDGKLYAQSLFGTLMEGVPAQVPEAMSPIDLLDTLIPMLGMKIKGLGQKGKATFDQGMGMQTVLNYCGQLIGKLQQNPAEKQRVKQYSDALGQLGNEAKALAQRGAEASKNNGNGGQDIEAQTNARATMIKTQVHAASAQSKMQLSAKKAALDEQRKNAALIGDQRRKNVSTAADIQRKAKQAEAQSRMKTFNEE